MQPTMAARRSSIVERKKRPTTMRPVNAVAESMRPKRSSAACTSRSDDSGFDRSRTPSTTSTAAPSAGELVDEAVSGIADDEVVVARGEQSRQRGPDVSGGVTDDRDSTSHEMRSNRAVNIGPYDQTS